MCAIYSVVGTSLVWVLFFTWCLYVLRNEEKIYKQKCVFLIKLGLVAPIGYLFLVFVMSFAEYPLGF